MSKAQHTPGPWKFLRAGMIVTQDESSVVGKFHVDTYSYNGEADRALIAAAPDLLAACEFGGVGINANILLHNAAGLLRELGYAEYASALAKKANLEYAAIAKAKGDSHV